MNWTQVGQNIKRYRNFQNKKQAYFAKEIGKTRQMLSRYENGRSQIPLATLVDIARKLNTPVSALLGTG